jgi:hypothetical protein
MKPEVMVMEDGPVTILSVKFPEGESAFACFFPEAENEEELAHQAPWRAMQGLMEFCVDCGGEKCGNCGLIRVALLGIVAMAIAAYFNALLGLLVESLFLALLINLLVPWYLSRHDRALKRSQREWLWPVKRRLLSFSEDNNFRGALNYALGVCK